MRSIIRSLFLVALCIFCAVNMLHAQYAIPYGSPELKNGRYRKDTTIYRVRGTVRHHKKQGRWIVKEPRTNSRGETEWVTTTDAHYRNDIPHGRFISFTIDGDTLTTGKYRHGMGYGEWRTYHLKELTSVEHFDDSGHFTGLSYYKNNNGELIRKRLVGSDGTAYEWSYAGGGSVSNYSVTRGTDMIVYWYAPHNPPTPAQDTLPVKITSWRNGKQHGVEFTFADGVKTSEAWFRDGVPDSITRHWRNGALIYEANFREGKKEGTERKWLEDGRLYAENSYRNGMQQGMQLSYDVATGTVSQKVWCVDGMIDSVISYTPDGRVVYREVSTDKEGTLVAYTTYHTNGTVATSGTRADGRETGQCQIWYDNGTRRAVINFANSDIEGAVDVWNRNGVHVFHGDASLGFDTVPELIWSNTGEPLHYGTEEYDRQRERYREYNLVLYNDTVFFTHDVHVRHEVNGHDDYSARTSTQLQFRDTTGTNKRIPPKFPGGFDEQLKYFQSGVHYPQYESEQGIGGSLFITFMVERDGSITGVTIAKRIFGAPGLSREAERLVKAMPKWTPAMKNGKVIRSKCVMKFVWDIRWV